MSSTTRALARPFRSLAVGARPIRTFATLPTKNPTPSGPIEPSRTQAHPIGKFYEAILNSPELLPEKKPEEPATSVKEEAAKKADNGNNGTKAAAANEPAETTPATKRGRKAKPVADANTAASKTSVSSTTTAASSDSSSSSSPPFDTNTTTAKPSTEEKAKVIFGSSLAGPAERAERLAQIRSKSTVIAGVVVPPKPEEPDNCCMSGCVNCVWERFRDEMETWAAANAEAEERLAAGKTTKEKKPRRQQEQSVVDHTTVSMDDDGGGSETNWDLGAVPTPASPGAKIAKDFWDDDLYRNVPVGIREFMKQEKRLKEKHLREESSGGHDG